LLAASAWLLLTDGSLRRMSRGRIAAALPLLPLSGVFLYAILREVFTLQRDGQLYLGGQEGFITDTVQALVRCSLSPGWASPAATTTMSAMLVAGFVLLLLFGLGRLVRSPADGMPGLLVLMLAAAVALPITQHHLLGTLFPAPRAALYLVPLYAIALLWTVPVLPVVGGRDWSRLVGLTLSAAIAVTLGWQSLNGFRVRSSCAWWEDRHNRDVLELIDRDAERPRGRSVRLGASWVWEPSLNFYRLTRRYDWLVPVTREPLTRSDADYLYAYERELDTLLTDRDIRLASYPDIGSALVRVHQADGP